MGCSSNDDCSNIDILPRFLYIEYIDPEMNELLENGHYDPDEVEVFANGVIVGATTTIDGRTYIAIPSPGAGSGNNIQYQIKLSATETDTMSIQYSPEEGACSTNQNIIQRLIYNGEEKMLLYFNGNLKITIVKPI